MGHAPQSIAIARHPPLEVRRDARALGLCAQRVAGRMLRPTARVRVMGRTPRDGKFAWDPCGAHASDISANPGAKGIPEAHLLRTHQC